jgi:RNA polymerase primary sigma factor
MDGSGNTSARPKLRSQRIRDLTEELFRPFKVENIPRIVELNLGFVHSIASQYSGYLEQCQLTIDDLVQEGSIGIIKAAHKFDISRGVRFSTYAAWWVRANIGRAVMQNGGVLGGRLSPHQGYRLTVVRRAERQARQSLGREPTDKEIYAAHLKDAEDRKIKVLSPKRFAETQLIQHLHPVSLDGENESGVSLHELIPSNHPSTETILLAQEQLQVIDQVFTDMMDRVRAQSARDADILAMRLSVSREDAPSLSAIAEKFDLSRERVRQIETREMRALAFRLRITVPKARALIERREELRSLIRER